MSNLLVNDIIRCYDGNNNNNIIFIETYGNGLITNIQDNNVTISWNINNIETYSLNNLNNFELDDCLKICKKITNDDWVDKDGNHYTNDGINITMYFQRLREERNKKLDETDHYSMTDYPHLTDSIKQAWYTYRQELRDLPSTSNPSLDTNGQLINVTWPILPS